MQPSPDDPRPKPSYDPADFPPLEELLKKYTLDQIQYGIHFSFEGGEEVSLVSPEPSPDATPPSAPPPRAESA